MTAWDGAGNEVKIFKENEIQQRIIHDHIRPTIPNNVPDVIGNIIRRCWLADIEMRPSFIEIVQSLSNYLNYPVKELDYVYDKQDTMFKSDPEINNINNNINNNHLNIDNNNNNPLNSSGNNLNNNNNNLNNNNNIIEEEENIQFNETVFVPLKKIEIDSKIRNMISVENNVWVSHITGISIFDAFNYSLVKRIDKVACNVLLHMNNNNNNNINNNQSTVWAGYEDGFIRVFHSTVRSFIYFIFCLIIYFNICLFLYIFFFLYEILY